MMNLALGSYVLPDTLGALLVLIVALLILWVVVSIPVFVSGSLITDGRAGLGAAMGATLGGGLVYLIILYAGTFLLAPILGASAPIISLILALFAWLAVYRSSFDTTWLGALGIVIVAWLVLFVMNILLASVFGVTLPKFYPF